jgi:serine/threonine protein kinase
MTDQNLTYQLNNDGVLSNIEKHSKGTMSARYICDYSEKGETPEKMFAKIFRHSSNCTGVASREVQKNEILVLEFLKTYFPQYTNLTLYENYGRVNGALCLLFKYIPGLAFTSENTLHSLLGVDDEFKDITLDMEKNNPLLRKLRVTANKKIESLEEVVHIATEMCEQADLFHNARRINDNGGILKDGIILVDISPSNVLIYKDEKGVKRVLLNDFGLAKERNMKASKLYSMVSVSGISGSYYTTQSGITVNKVYHPPKFDIDYGQSIEPSYDTYNLINLLCLMLTGKLVEPLKEKSGGDKSELSKSIINKLKEKYPSVCDGNHYQTLTDIIIKGTSSKDERYQSAGAIAQELKSLGLAPLQEYKVNPPTLNPITLPQYLKECKLSLPPGLEMESAYSCILSKVSSTKALSDEVIIASSKEYCSKPQAIDLFTSMVSEVKMKPVEKNTFKKALRIGLAATSIVAMAAAAGYFIATSDGCEYKLHADAPPEIKINERRSDSGKVYRIEGVVESGDEDIGLSDVRLYKDNHLVYEWDKNLGAKLDVSFSVDCPYGLTYTLTAMDKRGSINTESIKIKPPEFAGQLIDCKEELRTTKNVEDLGEIMVRVKAESHITNKLYVSLDSICGNGNCWSDKNVLLCEGGGANLYVPNSGNFHCEYDRDHIKCKVNYTGQEVNMVFEDYQCNGLTDVNVECAGPVEISVYGDDFLNCAVIFEEYICRSEWVCSKNNLILKAEIRNSTSSEMIAKLYNKTEVVKEWRDIDRSFNTTYSVGPFKDDCYVLDVMDSAGNKARSNSVPESCQINYTYTTNT